MPYPSVATPPSKFKPQGRKRAKYEIATRYAGVGYVPSEILRAHIDTLNGMGLPLASIARDAECTPGCVRNIHRGIWDTTSIRHAAAIKGVTHHPSPRQQIVLAVGAVRRAQALHAIGWTWQLIAEHTPGVTAGAIATMTRAGHERTICAWATWTTMHAAYETLSGTPAPESVGATKARNAARTRSWPPPLDWEDLDIDDPRVTVSPSGVETRTGLRERADARRQEVARLTRAGFSADEIAVRVGVTKRQVVRDRQAAGVGAGSGVAGEESAA